MKYLTFFFLIPFCFAIPPQLEIILEKVYTDIPFKKKLSPGQLKIEKIKAKNRQILRMKRKKKESPTDLNAQVAQTYQKWGKQVQETYASWGKAQKQFLNDIPMYKKNLGLVVSKKRVDAKEILKSISASLAEYQYLEENWKIPVKNQGKRPTCSAFAGIRGVEILLNGEKDLSEQFFYWASRPDCQKVVCDKRGSWVEKGFSYGRKQGIPGEKDCPYTEKEVSGPLEKECLKGGVRVIQTRELADLDSVISALKRKRPVVAPFHLDDSFYVNKGLVSFENRKGKGFDSHAKGHALLLVGYIKLPLSMRSEGKVCFLAVNSWGEGFGVGGYTCLTERWVKEYRFKIPFISIEEVSSS